VKFLRLKQPVSTKIMRFDGRTTQFVAENGFDCREILELAVHLYDRINYANINKGFVKGHLNPGHTIASALNDATRKIQKYYDLRIKARKLKLKNSTRKS
jgi:hypothetical protein